MPDSQGLDLSAQLAERLKEKFPTQETPTETPAPEAEQEVQQHKGLKAALLAQGVDVEEDLDDEAVAVQAAERIKQSIEKDRELDLLRQQLAELQQAQNVSKEKPAEPEAPKKEEKAAEEALSRWQKVDIDEELYNLVEQKDGRWVGKASLGIVGVEAAKKLNETIKERNRRADILTNDPFAALNEAGVIPAIRSEMTKFFDDRLKNLETQLEEKQTRAKREELEAQRKATEEAAAQSFMNDRRAEFFKVNESGAVLIDPTTKAAALTPAGKRVREITEEIMRDEQIEDPNKALRLACKIYDKEKAVKPAEPVKEDKKQAFLEKGRVQGGQRWNVATQDDDTPVTPGRLRLRDIVAASNAE